MEKENKRPLTAKQEAFCREYVKDFNATQAAIRAGYSAKTANPNAARLLAKDSIQEKIREFVEKSETKSLVTINEVVAGLKAEATHKKNKGSERVAAWSHLAKYLGMFDAKPPETADNVTPKIQRIYVERRDRDAETDKANERTGTD